MKRKIDIMDFTMWLIIAISILTIIAIIALVAVVVFNPELIGNYLGQIINALKSTNP